MIRFLPILYFVAFVLTEKFRSLAYPNKDKRGSESNNKQPIALHSGRAITVHKHRNFYRIFTFAEIIQFATVLGEMEGGEETDKMPIEEMFRQKMRNKDISERNFQKIENSIKRLREEYVQEKIVKEFVRKFKQTSHTEGFLYLGYRMMELNARMGEEEFEKRIKIVFEELHSNGIHWNQKPNSGGESIKDQLNGYIELLAEKYSTPHNLPDQLITVIITPTVEEENRLLLSRLLPMARNLISAFLRTLHHYHPGRSLLYKYYSKKRDDLVTFVEWFDVVTFMEWFDFLGKFWEYNREKMTDSSVLNNRIWFDDAETDRALTESDSDRPIIGEKLEEVELKMNNYLVDETAEFGTLIADPFPTFTYSANDIDEFSPLFEIVFDMINDQNWIKDGWDLNIFMMECLARNPRNNLCQKLRKGLMPEALLEELELYTKRQLRVPAHELSKHSFALLKIIVMLFDSSPQAFRDEQRATFLNFIEECRQNLKEMIRSAEIRQPLLD